MKKLTILLLVMLSSSFMLKAQEPTSTETKAPLDSLGMVARIIELEKELNERGNLKNLVQNLRQENWDLKHDTVPLYKEKVKQLEAMNGELRDENEKLSEFKGALLSQLSDKVVGRWLNLPYCQIDSAAFSDTLALFDKYKNDKKVGRAYAQMKALGENLDLYRRGKRAVNSPYDAKTVKELVQPMKNLSESVKSQGNKKNVDELAELYSQLDNYKGTLQYFQEDIIIGMVESNIQRWQSNGKSVDDAWILLESELPENDPYISKIPWLKNQYKAFYDQLKKDVYGPNPAKEAVKSLVP